MATRLMMMPTSRLIAMSLLSVFLLSARCLGDETYRPVVRTTNGPVRGLARGAISQFLGIPYAAPPTGQRRWMPPTRHSAWSQPIDASRFGSTCAQTNELGVFAGPVSHAEDCLTLNVYTLVRAASDPLHSPKLPVLVWIHGGGFFDGEAKDYDPSEIVTGGAAGPTVVVTLNYRLGLLGFLAHPALNAEGHAFGNYGLMDQQAALRWVRDNVATFGGDPNRITVGGQSAGATSAAALLVSPASGSLIQRVIFQSGFLLEVAPLAAANQRGVDFARAAECNKNSGVLIAACLRALPLKRILALQGTTTNNGPYLTGPMIDGAILRSTGTAAWESGAYPHIPIMNGITAEEGRFLASIKESNSGPLTAVGYLAFIENTFGGEKAPGVPKYPPGTKEAALREYPLESFATPSEAMAAVISDMWVCPEPRLNRLLAKYSPLYAYEFSYRGAPWYFPDQTLKTGAAHTSDIQFLFPTWHGGPSGTVHLLNDEQQRLSRQMIDAWTQFMYTGDPNATGGVALWPRYSNDREVYLSQDLPAPTLISGAEFAVTHKCRFWDQL